MNVPNLNELTLLNQNICQAVGDPKRMQIAYILHQKPQHVTAIAKALNLPQPTVSRHLAFLKQRSLVETQREGTSVIYSLSNKRLIDILDAMRLMLRETLNEQVGKLQTY
jgi:DNA-binding transcriptional ArsR family regulator